MPQPPPKAKPSGWQRTAAVGIGLLDRSPQSGIDYLHGVENKPITDFERQQKQQQEQALTEETQARASSARSEVPLHEAEGRRAEAEARKADLYSKTKPIVVADANGNPTPALQNEISGEVTDTNGNVIVQPKMWEKPVATPSDATKISADVEAQIGPQPNRKSFPPGPGGDKTFADQSKSWGQAAEKIINEKATAAAGARGASYGRNRPVQVLDTYNGNRPVTVSAGDAEDNPQRYVTQSGGEKALPKEALINDIRTSAQNVRSNLKVLDAKGLDRAKLAAALANPESTAGEFLQAIPRGSLDKAGEDFVNDLFNLREQAMAMRQLLGAGGGSEDVRRAILKTLPGVATPSSGFGEKQIDNLLAVLDRLEKGVPNVPMTDRGKTPGAPANGSKILKYDQQGNLVQ